MKHVRVPHLEPVGSVPASIAREVVLSVEQPSCGLANISSLEVQHAALGPVSVHKD